MKVRSGPEPKSRDETKGLYSYPDLVVICGEPQFHDEYRDVLLNPTAIIEVLSQSTEAFDRGEKWSRYQTWLPSLMHYVLVSQAKPQFGHYLRQPNGEWLYSSVKSLEGSLHLASIDCTLRLAEGLFSAKMAYELQSQLLWTQERTGRVLMKYTSIKEERKSNSKSIMVKHLLVLLLITMSLVFSGASATPTAKASAPCDMVCADYIDPSDGQCYTRCCPANDECKIRCFIMPCQK